MKRIPALTGEAIDTIGAGDAFFALAAPLLAAGSDPFLAAFIGNAVGRDEGQDRRPAPSDHQA